MNRPTPERLTQLRAWYARALGPPDVAELFAEIDALNSALLHARADFDQALFVTEQERDEAREGIRGEMRRVAECERDMHAAWRERDEALATCAALRALLLEWLETPFFATEEGWLAWVVEFRPRVERALAQDSTQARGGAASREER